MPVILPTGVIISIHAPREGGDYHLPPFLAGFLISIHAPREGGDCAKGWAMMVTSKFQSTPPARGATLQTNFYGQSVYISIHAPREGGDVAALNAEYSPIISIHAPREGGDCCHDH